MCMFSFFTSSCTLCFQFHGMCYRFLFGWNRVYVYAGYWTFFSRISKYWGVVKGRFIIKILQILYQYDHSSLLEQLFFLKKNTKILFFLLWWLTRSPSVFLCQSFCLLLSLFSGWVRLFWPPCSIYRRIISISYIKCLRTHFHIDPTSLLGRYSYLQCRVHSVRVKFWWKIMQFRQKSSSQLK